MDTLVILCKLSHLIDFLRFFIIHGEVYAIIDSILGRDSSAKKQQSFDSVSNEGCMSSAKQELTAHCK